MRLRHDDLRVGLVLTSPPVTVTEAAIIAYGRQFDPQPMHTDPQAALATPVGGLIASGWLTASIAFRLQGELGLPLDGAAEIESLAWPLPVRPGQTVHVQVEITGLPPDGRVQFRNTAVNDQGETVQVITGSTPLP